MNEQILSSRTVKTAEIVPHQGRILSIDVLRGIVMVIMALDHVRDFFHASAQTANPLDLHTTTPLLFFTRWLTHFCAPTFVFLSGVSSSISSRKKSRHEASLFLIKRGLWLLLVDFVVMSFALTFDPAFHFVMLTVLWAIGCSMIVMGGLLRISRKLLLPVGLLLFFGHDAFSNGAQAATGFGGSLLKVLFNGGYILPVNTTHLIGFLYPVLPWTGVMLLGYVAGPFVTNKKLLGLLGIGMILLFLILRGFHLYGEPVPWSRQKDLLYTLLSFINTTKYPPSLQFLLMTLGPALLLLAILPERATAFQRWVRVYGRVPFFYYVVHFFLAHLLLVVLFFASGHTLQEIADLKSPFLFRPHDFGISLPYVYLVWIFVVLAMYYPCRWFYEYKLTHRKWWLSYL
jgi:uncharacterized membrane protein